MGAEGSRRQRRLDAQHGQRGPASPGRHGFGYWIDPTSTESCAQRLSTNFLFFSLI